MVATKTTITKALNSQQDCAFLTQNTIVIATTPLGSCDHSCEHVGKVGEEKVLQINWNAENTVQEPRQVGKIWKKQRRKVNVQYTAVRNHYHSQNNHWATPKTLAKDLSMKFLLSTPQTHCNPGKANRGTHIIYADRIVSASSLSSWTSVIQTPLGGGQPAGVCIIHFVQMINTANDVWKPGI